MTAFVGLWGNPLLLAGFLVVFLVVRAIVRYRKLSQFRGPFWASISRSYIFWKSINRSLWVAECEAIEKYGIHAFSSLPSPPLASLRATL